MELIIFNFLYFKHNRINHFIKFLFILSLTFPSLSFSSDQKEGRFFWDQPDVNDDYQIHFNYIVTLDGEDRGWDVNGKLEKLLNDLNEVMYLETKANRFSNGVENVINLIAELTESLILHLSEWINTSTS